jgi:hypothetical protein
MRRAFTRIIDRHGPDALAFHLSGRAARGNTVWDLSAPN